MSAREQRRLAAIVAADVVGYSRLMGRDEAGTVARLRQVRAERLEPVLARRGGRIVKLTGDGALIEFGSAVEALSAAIEFQQAMVDTEAERSEAERLVFRVGAHLGDVAGIISTIGGDDALALSSAGVGLAWVCRDYEAGAAFVDRAVLVNPNLVHAWMNRGMVSTFGGEHEAAIEELRRARRISPIGPDYYLVQGYMAFCHVMLGQYEIAIIAGSDAAAHQPNWPAGHVILAAALGLDGNIEQARKTAEQVRRITTLPLTAVTSQFRRPEDRARLAEGLRLAGLPE